MAELIIEPEAEAELEEAGDRYEESVPGLGLDFLLEMRARTSNLPRLHSAIRPSAASLMCDALMRLAGFRISSCTYPSAMQFTCWLSCTHDGVRLTGRIEARCGGELTRDWLVRQLPELQRRNATPSDKTSTLVAARSPTKSNERWPLE